MLIKQICLEGFRNLQIPNKLEFHQNLNIFIGANGSGKTSLLESIYLLALGRSFRTSKINNVIKLDNKYTKISAIYTNKQANQLIKISTFKEQQHEKINKIGGALASNSEIIILTPTQLINDETSNLIFKSAELRRKFIDWLAFYTSTNYKLEWREFNRILQQRNQILKKLQFIKKRELIQVLANIDQIFVQISEKITLSRQIIWQKFEKMWQQVIIDLVLQDQMGVEIEFFKGWNENLSEQLIKNQHIDLKFGYSQIGPHKADLKFIVDKKSIAKEVLSRGQGKLLALTLILARSKFINTINHNTDFVSVLLIDDLCAELDQHNVKKVIQELFTLKNELQIFITGTDPEKLLRILPKNNCKWFKVINGEIIGCEDESELENFLCST